MLERAWRTTKDTERMLAHIGPGTSARKLRLFAAACCRRAWQFARDERLPPLLAALEDLADERTRARGRAARLRAFKVARAEIDDMQQCIGFELWHAFGTADEQSHGDFGEWAAAAFGYRAGRRAFKRAKGVERKQQAVLVREVFGNPFRPVAFDVKWRTDTVRALARRAYDAHEFGALPILADALQDAGCDSDDLLNHLRDSEATHYRGCWALDFVLGKV